MVCDLINGQQVASCCQGFHCLGCRGGEMSLLAVDASSLHGSKVPCGETSTAAEDTVVETDPKFFLPESWKCSNSLLRL